MGKKRLVAAPLSERARYDADKVRQRAEEALGWKAGSSKDMSFQLLLEALKAKPEKWKARRDIEDMLRTGDHLLASAQSEYRGTFADAPIADSLLDRAFRRSTGF